MKRCQEDSYLQQGVGTVLQCEAKEVGYRVLLDNSIFYPEGGGQPPDYGWIGSTRVTDVQQIETRVWHSVEEELSLGEYTQKLDWPRRFDHMQQHTGQHVLTAVILTHFGWPTVGFHLGEEVSYIDLETTELSAAQCAIIEQEVHKLILETPQVQAKIVSVEEYHSDPNIRSRGLPKGFQGEVRLIEIAGLDCNTCGGTHVAQLAELQCLKLIRTERVKRRIRLHFLFGDRVRRFLQACLEREKKLTNIFNQGPNEHVQIAEKWQTERKNSGRQIKQLQQELALYLGKELIGQEPSVLHRPGANMMMLSTIAKTAISIDPDSCFALTGEGVFIIQSENVLQHREQILSILEGKGGGKPPRLQGKCMASERVEEIRSLL